MHRCEFCNVMFEARPQVKRPRACDGCQRHRQRENEKAWHNRHKGLYDNKYHQVQKAERYKCLKEVAERILKLIEVGKTFLGEALDLKEMGDLLHRFLIHFGIRKINKFWPSPISPAGK